MKYSISLFTTLLLLSSLLLFSGSAQAHDVEPSLSPATSTKEMLHKERGGTRSLIQLRNSATVTQTENEFLEIVIINETGESVHESTTTALKTVISIENWDSGSYTVITTDAYGDRQDFYMIIE